MLHVKEIKQHGIWLSRCRYIKCKREKFCDTHPVNEIKILRKHAELGVCVDPPLFSSKLFTNL